MIDQKTENGEQTTSRRKKNKNEKKKQKEDEIRGPKDTKVVLIDPSTFSSLRDEEDIGRSRDGLSAEINLSASDFPSLGIPVVTDSEIPFNSRWGGKKLYKDPFPSLVAPEQKIEQVSRPDTGQQPVQPQVGSGRSMQKVASKKNKTSMDLILTSKKKRSKAPMVLDLSKAIKMHPVSKQRKSISFNRKSHHIDQPDRLTGNILDSSNPVRSKGKFRENKKKKLTHLKMEIIKERILKSMGSTNVENMEQIDLKEEIEIYLKNLREERSTQKNKCSDAFTRNKESNKGNDAIVPIRQFEQEKHQRDTPFTSKFRPYCDNVITPELNMAVKDLIQNIVALQDRAFSRDPLRARMRKRHVAGLREVTKYLHLKRTKLIIVAPDLEMPTSEGTICTTINTLKAEAETIGVPCVFALNRRKLGYFSLKKAPVSAFAILSYEGLEDRYRCVVEHLQIARNLFKQKFEHEVQTSSQVEATSLISSFLEKLVVTSSPEAINQEQISPDILDERTETTVKNPFIEALLSRRDSTK